MSIKISLPAALGLGLSLCTSASATPVPFGVASAYNIFAIGSGSTPGTVTVGSDIGGRVAAGGLIGGQGGNITVGANPIANDFYASSAPLAPSSTRTLDVYAPGGFSGSANINSTGDVYDPGGSGGSFNFNGGGTLVSTTITPAPINFTTVGQTLTNDSSGLSQLMATGTTALMNNDLVLTGVSNTLNIFTVTPTQLASATDQLEIVAPAGSTIIVNVTGVTDTLPKLSYNGQQVTGDSPLDSGILFNFVSATSVTLNGQFSGAILAPLATIYGTSQLDGQFFTANFNDTGEIHNVEFNGVLPLDPGNPGLPAQAPEPSSLVLLGSGVVAVAGVLRRRVRGRVRG